MTKTNIDTVREALETAVGTHVMGARHYYKQALTALDNLIDRDAVLEMLEGMKEAPLPPEASRCDEVMFSNRALDAVKEKIKGM